jgi:hypothetical protein
VCVLILTMMYSLFKLTIELPDFVQGETCYNYMFVIFLEYHIYDAVYVNTNKITRQSTGLTINIIIKGPGQRIVVCLEYQL